MAEVVAIHTALVAHVRSRQGDGAHDDRDHGGAHDVVHDEERDDGHKDDGW